MNRVALLFLLLLFSGLAISQPAMIKLNDREMLQIEHFSILPDQGYDVEKILKDTTLRFVSSDSISPGAAYWLEILVVNPYSVQLEYSMNVFPNLKNTLYYFDKDQGKWVPDHSGALNNQGARLTGRHQVKFQGKSKNYLYLKIDLKSVHEGLGTFKPRITLTKRAIFDKHEQNIRTAWISGIIVLLVFFLNNLYLYISFRDKTILYYLIAQLGGMIYLTGYRWFFLIIFPRTVFSFRLHTKLGQYDVNMLMTHIAILLIFYGFVQFTRSFLNTKRNLPACDQALKYGLIVYGTLSFIGIFVNVAGFFLEYYTSLYDNIFCFVLIAAIITTCVVGYIHKLPAAKSFLMANILPLFFMLSVPLFHIFVSFDSEENLWLPELAVISVALAFSIALVARTKTIQNELAASRLNNSQLEFDLKEVGYLYQLNEMEIEKMNSDIRSEKARNELLQQRLDTKQRELVSSTLYVVQKNELLTRLKMQVQEMNRKNRKDLPTELREIEAALKDSLQLDSHWHKFKMHFEQVHPDFFEKLSAKHPSLTPREIRIYAYFYIKLSTKEIASLLDIDPASVRRAKTRLYRKMAIPENDED